MHKMIRSVVLSALPFIAVDGLMVSKRASPASVESAAAPPEAPESKTTIPDGSGMKGLLNAGKSDDGSSTSAALKRLQDNDYADPRLLHKGWQVVAQGDVEDHRVSEQAAVMRDALRARPAHTRVAAWAKVNKGKAAGFGIGSFLLIGLVIFLVFCEGTKVIKGLCGKSADAGGF